ncbi:MAG: hypothetical protein FWC71_06955 [Defluviitaleaceae bacterium]|nr:hypothetical protein [Defluviitaleaceae bacterium]
MALRARLYEIKWNPAVALVALFFSFVVVAAILSSIYVSFMGRMANPFGQMVAPFILGAALGGTVFGLKRLFTVRWDIPAGLVIVLGCLTVYVMAWNGFPLRGPLEIFEFWQRDMPEAVADMVYRWELPERVHRAAGIIEGVAIAVPPLFMAFRRAGVFMKRHNRWAKLKVLDYGFQPFHDHELDQLAVGDSEVLLRKGIDLTGHNRIHCIATCYVDDTLTEYLAVFKAGWNRHGQIEHGSLLLLTLYTPERIQSLVDALYEIHRESEVEYREEEV